jgi:DNA-binding YbaB/EbfC family protein
MLSKGDEASWRAVCRKDSAVFQGLSNIAALMRQAQQIGPKLQAIQQQLKDARATGSSGGDMVTVEVNGLSEVVAVHFDPALVARGDVEMMQDLTVAAVNVALAKSKELHVNAMKSLTSDSDMPGLQDMLARMTGPDA